MIFKIAVEKHVLIQDKVTPQLSVLILFHLSLSLYFELEKTIVALSGK